MAPSSSGRRARLFVAAAMLALFASLVPMATVFAAVVNPATGGSAIPADEFGTSNFTTLTGPQIAEAAAGELTLNSTTILNVPAGFQFNPGAGTVAFSSVAGTCTMTGTLTVTASQATFKVTTASSVNACVVSFVGLQVQPTAGPGLTSGNITKTGTSVAPAGATNYGTLTKVAGAVTELIYLTQPSAANSGGSAFGTQPRILARDQFGNAVANVPVTLSITPGTGATGAAVTCTTNPLSTNGAGVADFTTEACKIDLAGSYRLRGTSGTITVDSGTFTVNVGVATKIIFKSYPAATTPPLLNPQPRVAVTDAGGNTVTSFPPANITLAINKNSGTFTCTGGLVAQTVNGEASWTGCAQTTPDSGYQITATIGFANAVGTLFTVTPPALAFIAGPGAPVVGQPFPTAVQVAIQNAGVTQTTGISSTVTLALGNNPTGATLTCTGGTSVGTIGGVATFTGCSIDKVGTGYTLTATASSVLPGGTITAATSAPFNVTLATTPAVISLTSFCGSPTPKSLSGPNQCSPDTSKTPVQANIKLPQNLNEGVWLQAHIASNGAGRLLTFEVSKDQVTWSTVGTATTDGAGNASVFYRPSDNRYYRATFAGSGELGAGTSPTLRVVVRALVFIRPTGCTSTSPCRLHLPQVQTLTAIARPNRPELPTQTAVFTIQQKSGGTWVTTNTPTEAVSKSTGQAVVDFDFNVRGTFRVRVNLLPTSVNANSFPTEFEYFTVG